MKGITKQRLGTGHAASGKVPIASLTGTQSGRYIKGGKARRIAELGTSRAFLLSIWLAIIFALGGSSRPDAPNLPLLRVLAIGVTMFGAAELNGTQIRAYRGTLAFWFAMLLLAVTHLIPLPPAVWMSLPGRHLISEVDSAAGLGLVWRPLSMDPRWTWNALWSLFVPLSVMLQAIQLDREGRVFTLKVLVVIGVSSALWGIGQILGPNQNALYIYPVTNHGTPVGFFANRNHHAVFLACCVPLAFVWLRDLSAGRASNSSARYLRLAAGLSVIALLGLIVLVSGSRSGLLTFTAGLLLSLIWLSPFLMRHAGPRGRIAGSWKAALSFLLCMVALAVIAIEKDRALAIYRLAGDNADTDLRVRILPTVFEMIERYMPFGSGLGTFETVYLIDEPDSLLVPSYTNHVHNDWLELIATAGIPGIALFLWAIMTWCLALWRQRGPVATGVERDALVAALIIGLILAVASLSDYLLRVPSVFALAALVATLLHSDGRLATRRSADSSGDLEPADAPDLR